MGVADALRTIVDQRARPGQSGTSVVANRWMGRQCLRSGCCAALNGAAPGQVGKRDVGVYGRAMYGQARYGCGKGIRPKGGVGALG